MTYDHRFFSFFCIVIAIAIAIAIAIIAVIAEGPPGM
ncbi:MAG: hypothetical protein ACI90V_000083 [Bacillariaceae sp.]|jgi:hypothetical protein